MVWLKAITGYGHGHRLVGRVMCGGSSRSTQAPRSSECMAVAGQFGSSVSKGVSLQLRGREDGLACVVLSEPPADRVDDSVTTVERSEPQLHRQDCAPPWRPLRWPGMPGL